MLGIKTRYERDKSVVSLPRVSCMKAILVCTVTAWFCSTSIGWTQTLAPINQIANYRLERDVAPFPNFFKQGRENLNTEIQLLYQRENTQRTSNQSPPESPLRINVQPQEELERLPQIRPSDVPSQEE
jgi:hypothetical protein